MHSHSLKGGGLFAMRSRHLLYLLFLLVASLFIGMPEALAHAVAEGDKGFIQESTGVMLIPFIYMGAKHMVTGYDHLLFLFGVIFFLYRLKDVGLYVTLFAVGHSVTLLHGFGLATKIQEYEISPDGLIPNLIAFNVGVEIGQLMALSAILILMGFWRQTPSFWRHAYTANVAMMSAGFLLMGYQISGLFLTA